MFENSYATFEMHERKTFDGALMTAKSANIHNTPVKRSPASLNKYLEWKYGHVLRRLRWLRARRENG